MIQEYMYPFRRIARQEASFRDNDFSFTGGLSWG